MKTSTVIQNAAYHTGGLELTFTGGKTYRYDCPANVYYTLQTVLSKGKYYNLKIKGQYPSYEVPLSRAVEIAFDAFNGKPVAPEIQICGDVILVNGKPYGGGAKVVAEYFLNRASTWLRTK